MDTIFIIISQLGLQNKMMLLPLLVAVALSVAETCPYCPQSCLASTFYCLNSINGTGVHHSRSPSVQDNQCDNCMAGHGGITCETCVDDSGCPVEGTSCKHSIDLHDNTPGILECAIDDQASLGLLGGLAAVVGIKWEKKTNWTNPATDGTMSFHLYRLEDSEPMYQTPFMQCSADQCSMKLTEQHKGKTKLYPPKGKKTTTTTNDNMGLTTSMPLNIVQHIIIGALVASTTLLCAAYCAKSGKRRRQLVSRGTCLFVVLLCVLIVHHIATDNDNEAIISQEPYTEVEFHCKTSSCECSPPSPRTDFKTTPCIGEMVETALADIKGAVDIKCDKQKQHPDNDPSQSYFKCAFYAADLWGGVPISLQCAQSQCSIPISDMEVVKEESKKDETAFALRASFGVLVGLIIFQVIYYFRKKFVAKSVAAEWRSKYLTCGEAELDTVTQYQLTEPNNSTNSSSSLKLGTLLLSYRIGDESKTILQKLTFEVPPGQSLAIMGPSGAGKTTLLDLLAAREKSGITTGSIVVNGQPVTSHLVDMYKDVIGYVSQEDTLIPSLTVFESVLYSARLRLPAGMPDDVKRAKVESVLKDLGLWHCKDSRIGGRSQRGISGGEKRRVSIAMELVANPRVLFLDEPTSGLDSYSAFIVMQAIAKLKTVSCTSQYASFFDYKPVIIFSIHQPSREIFNTFDNLMLLSKGSILYCGQASEAMDSLGRMGHRAPEGTTNPSDFLLKIASTMSPEERQLLAQKANMMGLSPSVDPRTDILDILVDDDSDFEYVNDPLIGSAKGDGTIPEPLQEAMNNRKYYCDFYQELSIVSKRSYHALVGSYSLVLCHICVTLMLALLLTVFYSRQPLSLPGILNRAGSLSFTMLLLGFSSLSALEVFISERDVYTRERANRYHGAFSYFLSKIAFDIIPLRVIPPIFLGCVTYNQMGLRTV